MTLQVAGRDALDGGHPLSGVCHFVLELCPTVVRSSRTRDAGMNNGSDYLPSHFIISTVHVKIGKMKNHGLSHKGYWDL